MLSRDFIESGDAVGLSSVPKDYIRCDDGPLSLLQPCSRVAAVRVGSVRVRYSGRFSASLITLKQTPSPNSHDFSCSSFNLFVPPKVACQLPFTGKCVHAAPKS